MSVCRPSNYEERIVDVPGKSVILRIHPSDSVTEGQIRVIQSSLEPSRRLHEGRPPTWRPRPGQTSIRTSLLGRRSLYGS